MCLPFYVYMLCCSDGSYYVGHTDDLEKRITEHENGEGCDYTSMKRPVRLVWSQEFDTREKAKEMEARLKKWSRRKKEALIRGDFYEIRRAAKKNFDRE